MGFIYGLLIGAVLAVVGEEYGIPHFDRDMFSKSACSRAAPEKCNGPHVCRYVGVQGERSLVKKEGTPCPEVVLIPWREMNSALHAIAGHQQERERDACKEALRPHIPALLREGMQPASIITALAELTVFTIDPEGWQLN